MADTVQSWLSLLSRIQRDVAWHAEESRRIAELTLIVQKWAAWISDRPKTRYLLCQPGLCVYLRRRWLPAYHVVRRRRSDGRIRRTVFLGVAGLCVQIQLPAW